MITDILKAWNKIVNTTASDVLAKGLPGQVSDIFKTYMETSLQAVVDLTKEQSNP